MVHPCNNKVPPVNVVVDEKTGAHDNHRTYLGIALEGGTVRQVVSVVHAPSTTETNKKRRYTDSVTLWVVFGTSRYVRVRGVRVMIFRMNTQATFSLSCSSGDAPRIQNCRGHMIGVMISEER